MSVHTFDPTGIRIGIPVFLDRRGREVELLFSLDTGSTRTSIRPRVLDSIGVDLSRPVGTVSVRGVFGVGSSSLFTIPSLKALDHRVENLTVISQDFPKSVTIDGLLGLDFFRGRILKIDFSRGLITLRPPYSRWQFWR